MSITKDDLALLEKARDDGKNLEQVIETAEYMLNTESKRQERLDFVSKFADFTQNNLLKGKYDTVTDENYSFDILNADYLEYLAGLQENI